jgi:hypothetical protein
MACHGDRGQGLTEEWRSAWSPGDQNCWQSKCHAANHPPQGFELPVIIPGLIGEGTLPRFETAADLELFICERMPWYAPRTLDETTCWQLAAFLLRENGVLPDGVQLDATNADSVPVNPNVASPINQVARGAAVLAVLAAGALLLRRLL